jgi:hypothetical protein
MSTQVTLTIPDEIYQRAHRFARLTNQDIASVLAHSIVQAIPPLGEHLDTLPANTTCSEAFADLTDTQILALTELQLEPEQDNQLSHLLDQQQAGTLTEDTQIELEALLQLYQEGLVRKATAIAEAVKRGIMAPLSA